MDNYDDIKLWIPSPLMPQKIYDLQYIRFSGSTLTIAIFDDFDDKDYIFKFKNFVFSPVSFRYVSEYHNFEYNDLYGEWVDKLNLKQPHSLIVATRSDYIEQVKALSFGALGSEYDNLKHYIFYLLDNMIEIVTNTEPVFQIKKRKQKVQKS